jgi:hypothetical protein
VPNEYTVYLSTADHEQFAGYESSLVGELEEYLVEHAKRESYALLTPPRLLLEVDDDLEIGEFGIATRMVQPRQGAKRAVEEPEGEAEPGATMIYKPRSAPPVEEDAPPPEVDREVASLAWDGESMRIAKRRVLLGRSRECDIQVEDPNVSRRHAELRQEGSSYWIVDLDSTNGVEVNGKRVKRARLSDGDSFTVGSTEITFSTERE